jgi:hypothetical protein
MSPIPHVRRTLLATLALCALSAGARGQAEDAGFDASVPKLGEIRGLTTLRGRVEEAEYEEKSFLAVWYYNLRTDQKQFPRHETFLVIFEPQQEGYREVFRYDAKEFDKGWTDIVPLDARLLAGLHIKIPGVSDDDGAVVVALVGGKFRVVFDGETSEFVDLNQDGFPEVLESQWPDGDGHPKWTRVHVWNGKSYKFLMRVAFRQRLGLPVLRAVERAAYRPKPAKHLSTN